MSVDRGGLDYVIKVRNEFSSALQNFRSETDLARKEWASLKAELQQGASATVRIKQSIDDTAKSIDKQAKATERSARASRKKVESLTLEEEALKRADATQRRIQVTALRNQILLERGIDLTKKKTRALTAEEAANRKINQIVFQRSVQEKLLQKAAERGIDLSKKKVKQFDAEAEAQRRLINLQQRQQVDALFKQKAQAAGILTQIPKAETPFDPNAIARRRLESQLQEREIARSQKNLLDSDKRFKELNKTLGETETRTSRVLFTFRRLFGIFAAFQAVRLLVGSLRDAVSSSILFNSNIEDATLGIQSLLTATATLATASGRIAEGPEKFVIAQKEAVRQVKLLRLEGLKTASSFDQLLQAFQTALAPGVRAGLAPDEIRGFAVRIAQAAAAIGLPQNQLAEEIRSILQGTIQARTTRIAVALGITNEDIRRAKEAGNVAEFLTERFKAFEIAGEAALNNFSVILANTKAAVQELLGAGGEEFFNDLKTGLNDVLLLLTQQDAKGGVILNPDAVKLAQAFFSVLRSAVGVARSIGESLTLKGSIQVAEQVASVLNAVLQITGAVVKGILDGFRLVSVIVQGIVKLLSDVFGGLSRIPVDDFLGLVRVLAGAVVAAKALRLVVSGLVLPFTLISTALSTTATAFKTLIPFATTLLATIRKSAIGAVLLSTPFLTLAAVISAIVAVFNSEFLRSIVIGEKRIGTYIDLFKVDLVLAIRASAAFFEKVWINAISGVRRAFNRVIEFFKDTALSVAETVLEILDAAPGVDFEGPLEDIRNLRKEIADETDKENESILKAADEKLNKIRDEINLAKQTAALRKQEIDDLDRAGKRVSISQLIEDGTKSLQKFLGVQDIQNDKLEKTEDNVDNIATRFKSFPAIVAQTTQGLEDQADTVKDLLDNLRQAQDQLSLSEQVAGIKGFGKEALSAFANIQVQLRESGRQLTGEITQSEETLQGLSVRRLEINKQLTDEGRNLLQVTEALATIGSAITDNLNEQQVANLKLKKLLTDRRNIERIATAEQLKALDEQINKTRQQIRDLETSRQALIKLSESDISAAKLTAEEREKVLSSARELAEIDALQKANMQVLNQLLDDRSKLEKIITEENLKRLRALAIEQSMALEISNKRLQAEVASAKIAQEAFRLRERSGTANQDAQRLFALASELKLQQNITQELTNRSSREINALRASLERARGTEAELDIQKQLNLAVEEFGLETENNTLKVTQLGLEYQILLQRLEAPISTGFEQALNEFRDKATDTFEFAKNLGMETFEGLASFIATNLNDALSGKDVDLVGSFQNLISQLNQIILEFVARALILKTILAPLGLGTSTEADIALAQAAAISATAAAASAAASAATALAAAAQAAAVSATSAVTGGAQGFWRGGYIGSETRGVASPGHFSYPQGLHAGGRPKGLHPRDTVPIWAARGEFMQPIHAVRKYGLDFMERLRRGALDPSLVRSLSGLQATKGLRIHRPSGAGFATGGFVTERGSGIDSQGTLNIINVFDKSELLAEMASREGQQVLVNVIRSRQDSLRGAR